MEHLNKAGSGRPYGQSSSVFIHHIDHPTVMMDKATSESERHAKWVAAQDIGQFQRLLNAENEDGKHRILAQLLSHELEQLKSMPRL